MPSGRPSKGHGSIGILGPCTPISSASTLQLLHFGDLACHCRPVTTFSDGTRRDDLSTQCGENARRRYNTAVAGVGDFGRLPASDMSMRLGMVCTAIGGAGWQVWHAESTPDCGAGFRVLCQACPSGRQGKHDDAVDPLAALPHCRTAAWDRGRPGSASIDADGHAELGEWQRWGATI